MPKTKNIVYKYPQVFKEYKLNLKNNSLIDTLDIPNNNKKIKTKHLINSLPDDIKNNLKQIKKGYYRVDLNRHENTYTIYQLDTKKEETFTIKDDLNKSAFISLKSISFIFNNTDNNNVNNNDISYIDNDEDIQINIQNESKIIQDTPSIQSDDIDLSDAFNLHYDYWNDPELAKLTITADTEEMKSIFQRKIKFDPLFVLFKMYINFNERNRFYVVLDDLWAIANKFLKDKKSFNEALDKLNKLSLMFLNNSIQTQFYGSSSTIKLIMKYNIDF